MNRRFHLRNLLALLLATPAHAREHAPARLCLPARRRLQHRAGHPLRDRRQFHRPSPARLGAAECILRREAAEALKRVQADLAKENLGLKVYDCYRPTRAVRAMAAWAHDGEDSEATRRFYPALHKRNLFALGYIAAQSSIQPARRSISR